MYKVNPDLVRLDESIPFVNALYGVLSKQISKEDGTRLALRHLLAAEERNGLNILTDESATNSSPRPESEAEYQALVERHIFPFLKETSFMIAGLHYGQLLAIRFANGKFCKWSSRGWGGMLADFANSNNWKISEMRKAFQWWDPSKDTSQRKWEYFDFADTPPILDGEEWQSLVWKVLCEKWGYDPK